jgi:short subunit dehydrogenase-like uncharacterized protein
MASINTKVVHRTNYLAGFAWHHDFLYDEAMALGKGVKGWWRGILVMSGLAVFAGMASTGWGRAILTKWLVPKPGEGPNDDTVRNGFFKLRLLAMDNNTVTATATVTGQGDPGYGSTSYMITEVARTLLEQDELDVGFITPATLGQPLLDGLQRYGKLEFTWSEQK